MLRPAKKTDLVVTQASEWRFVGWPLELPEGDLLFFYGEQFSPEEGIPLVMARSGPDGTDQVQVRPEEFCLRDALWAEDGSLALLLGSCCGKGTQLLLARPDSSPLEVLINQAGGDGAWPGARECQPHSIIRLITKWTLTLNRNKIHIKHDPNHRER